jgi:hypothetical protein
MEDGDHGDGQSTRLAALTARQRAFHTLVRANGATEGERHAMVEAAAGVLTVDEVYHASTVIALFNFYNTFVDLNGVDGLTPEGYRASGVRLSAQGYAAPAAAAPASAPAAASRAAS